MDLPPSRLLCTACKGLASPPPPPYTPFSTESQPSHLNTKTLRLRRFLIDIIAFAYGADLITLCDALSGTPLASSGGLNLQDLSILSHDERGELHRLSYVVLASLGKAAIGLKLSDHDLALLDSDIVRPTHELNITLSYVLELLYYYRRHKGVDRRFTGLYGYRCILWHRLSEEELVQRLHSDDRLVERIAPNDRTRLLLKTAIADFGEQELENQAKSGSKRSFRSPQPAIDLAQRAMKTRDFPFPFRLYERLEKAERRNDSAFQGYAPALDLARLLTKGHRYLSPCHETSKR
ncbi:hypothetical protein P153DRAFT_355945 [Dothidotthia symphoricarpi CBS 119687]|uniref:Uncharacterized protein n=1 Tax=Dothidotthia symphoricarpi CBS 119687 TaxID=1392245 RepID=A0A6A6AJA5_9PLEO|nr:uncharacterized protein P153DRAFT_355945 [Dothidotthia symphoricarpi CBS 119687]KAF2131188.1 hypothetical protein P153DRAFT_355945 [Dothidotthia symphoricarpi CBS 119687]